MKVIRTFTTWKCDDGVGQTLPKLTTKSSKSLQFTALNQSYNYVMSGLKRYMRPNMLHRCSRSEYTPGRIISGYIMA